MLQKFKQNNNNLSVAYYRYSSASQNEASIEEQQQYAHKYAEEHGYTIIREYIDQAKTATKTGRPDFDLMCEEIPRLRVALLIAWRVDRTGRNQKDFVKLDEVCLNAGTDIRYVMEPELRHFNGSTLYVDIKRSMAVDYSRILSENIQAGNNLNASKALSNGHKIFGYKRGPDKSYVEDPDTAWVVPRIFNDYDSGKPLKQIADEINALGIQTVRGGKFNIENLRKILKNDRYTGLYRYGNYLIPGGMPALISQDLYDRVQAQFAKNKQHSSHVGAEYRDTEDDEPRYWLTGKLYCAKCGSSMHGIHGNKKGIRYYYYACKEKRRHRCTKQNVRKEWIEARVTELLRFLLNKDDNTLIFIENSIKQHEALMGKNNDLRMMEKRLKEVEKELKNLVDAIRKYNRTSVVIMDTISELEAEQAYLQNSIEVERALSEHLRDFDFREIYRKYLNANLDDPLLREELLNYFVDKIFLDDDGKLSFIIKIHSKNGVELKPMTPEEIIDFSGYTSIDTFVNSSTTTLEADASRVFFCL